MAVKKEVVPTAVKTQLESTLWKVKRSRWTYQGDVWDLEKALKLMKSGEARKAARLLYGLDSDVLDRLSNKVYAWMESLRNS